MVNPLISIHSCTPGQAMTQISKFTYPHQTSSPQPNLIYESLGRLSLNLPTCGISKAVLYFAITILVLFLLIAAQHT